MGETVLIPALYALAGIAILAAIEATALLALAAILKATQKGPAPPP